jgi:hypothetical protein
MTIPQYLLDLAEWGMNVAFWASIVFITFIGWLWPWWRSFWGINIVTLEIAIALALLGSILETDFGLGKSQLMLLEWISITALWMVGGIILWRGFLVISAQVHGTFGVTLGGVMRRAARSLLRKQQPTPPPPPAEQELESCPPK